MESTPENTITQNFNPFDTAGAGWQLGATGLIYEPLIQYNLAAPPAYYPWLATKYAWSDGGKKVTFTIRTGVKWSDGKPLTPADVTFSYNLIRKYPTTNIGGLQITSVSSAGDTVTLGFATSQYTNLQNIAGIAIVPMHIWAKIGNPATYADANPVGSGPYVFSSFTPEGFTLKKNPDYWQHGKPAIQSVYFPVYTSNTSALSALYLGKVDWTGNFIPGIQKQFVDKAPAYNHYWEPAGGDNSFWPNLTKWPTNQLPVRKAISLAVSRSVLASEGEAGLEQPVLNASGLTLPEYAPWSGPVKSMTVSANGNAAAARAVLKNAGFTLGSNGYFEKGGKTVSLTIIDPAAYTDAAEVDSIASQELKAAGIKATFSGLTVNGWAADVAAGNFQLTYRWSNSGVTPYNMYDNWLDSSLATGKSASGDFERLNDPAIQADLAKLAGAATVAQQTADLVPIEKFVAADLPIIPLVTSAQWYEYDSRNFVGWPSQANPYETGSPVGFNLGGSAGTDEVVILHLQPRK